MSCSTNFNSASELADAMKRLGKNFNILQLSQGFLNGHIAVCHLKGLSLFSIQTNQLLLFNGDRGDDCISFCVEMSGNHNDHRIHADVIDPHSVHGFKPDLSESHFQLTAGSTTIFAVTSSKKFLTFIEHCGHPEIIEILHKSNSLQLPPKAHTKLCRQFFWHINQPLQRYDLRTIYTEQLYFLLLTLLKQSDSHEFKPFKITPRQQIIHDFVNWGFNNANKTFKLDDISTILYSSRRTLIQGCKENFQIGPMELLKSIRLEQVNRVLRSNAIRQSLELSKVGDVAHHFGFTSRGHFSAAYQSQFGESPRQTLNKSKLLTQA